MVNAWIMHVKQFARENGLSYGCAISTPECRQSYHRPSKIRRERRERRPHSRRQLSEREKYFSNHPQLYMDELVGEYIY